MVWQRPYPPPQTLKCPTCVWREDSYVQHVYRHFPTRPAIMWVCTVCKEAAESRSAIAQHLRTRTDRVTQTWHRTSLLPRIRILVRTSSVGRSLTLIGAELITSERAIKSRCRAAKSHALGWRHTHLLLFSSSHAHLLKSPAFLLLRMRINVGTRLLLIRYGYESMSNDGAFVRR